MTVARVYYMYAKDGMADELEQGLCKLVDLVMDNLEGCRGVEVRRDIETAGRFMFVEHWDSIEAHKAARDAANEEMRKHKELRNAYQDQAKALIAQKKGKAGGLERSLPLMVRKLRNDLQAKIELQQTTTLSVAKERVLVEEISAIWKDLKEKEAELKKQQAVAVELTGADQDIDALFAKADAEHEEVLKHQKVAQEHHEKFIAAVKETRVLVNEANAKHAEFVAHKTKADEMHGKAMELREKVMSIRNERKAAFDAARQEVREVNQVARRNVNDPKAIERHTESLLEQMKKGGKISLGF